LLENPKRFRHADMPEVPSQRAEIRMHLAAKIFLANLTQQSKGMRPRLREGGP
jgi:hypothetical protein